MKTEQFAMRFGPWAVVTGASSGIGTGYARELAARGINLVLVARSDVRLKEVAEEVEEAHAIETRVVSADLADEDFIEDIRLATDGLDIGLLVSNADVASMGAMLRVPIEELARNLSVNTTAHLRLTHHFGEQLVARGSGGIVLVGSMAGMQGTPFGANYAGAKAYIHMLGQALNYELKDTGVNVSVVAPGPTNTPAVHGRTDIDLSKLPGPVMAVDKLVAVSLTGLSRNKPIVIAGASNRMIDSMSRRILPRQTGRNMMASITAKHVPAELSMQ
jgi:short-subunit dehydrogenase